MVDFYNFEIVIFTDRIIYPEFHSLWGEGGGQI